MIIQKQLIKTKVRVKPDTINLEFDRDRMERFCNALGLFREDFIDSLDKSALDSKKGDVYEIKELMDLV